MLEMEATFCDISASDTWKRENIFFMELCASSTHDNNSRFSALVQKKFKISFGCVVDFFGISICCAAKMF
jgi:hypothetical protein